MLVNAIVIARAAVRFIWLGAMIGVLALAAIPHLLPYAGREMYVVRGASMQPTIPVGAVVVVGHVDPTSVSVGDVVTFRAANGTVVTHRVLSIAGGSELGFQTKGDGSATIDPIVVPAHALIGRVESFVPGVGVIVVTLASTIGFVAAVALMGGLLLSMKFMDELLAAARPNARRRTVLTEPAR